MIPKKIHWCWLSGDPLPESVKKYQVTWKYLLPDYKIKCWTQENFDVDSVPIVKEAVTRRRWAFASDYIRLHAVYTEGGIYFDSDVVLFKSFNEFLKHRFFTAIEISWEGYQDVPMSEVIDSDGLPVNRPVQRYIMLQAAIFGAESGHPFLKTCMDHYRAVHKEAFDYYLSGQIVAPHIYADMALKYGFRYKDELQQLNEGMVIYPHQTFAGYWPQRKEESYALHTCAGGWRTQL